MKENSSRFGRFLKWSCIAFALFCLLALLGLILLIGVCHLGKKHNAMVQNHSILMLNLGTGITDQPATDGFKGLFGGLFNGKNTVSVREVTQSLHEAATDKRIAAVYIYGSIAPEGYESGLAALKEVRQELINFHQSGKPVIAYLVYPNQRDLYLASVADEIWLNPAGMVEWKGLAAVGTFYKAAGDKYGIEFQPTRHGKYKSAVEPFLRNDFSPESREQLGALLQNAWGEITRSIADSRKLKPETLQAIAQDKLLLRPEEAKADGIVTALGYEGDVLEKLSAVAGVKEKDDAIPHVSMTDYAGEAEKLAEKGNSSKDKIAIVYAEGEIVDGMGDSEGQIGGDKFAKMLREIREDKNIKALVLRVNSPGGSASASEVIVDELHRIAKDRPVVVSMGTVAASGGYLISTAADRIFAEPSTITGSIGVFGMGLNIQKLANDHGVTFDSVTTSPHADIGTISRPMDEFEQAKVQELVDNFYVQFITAVANCRKLTTNQVDAIAQGRVWSGTDGLKQGLVDETGGLDAAIADAAKRAKLSSYEVQQYPKKGDFFDELFNRANKKNDPLAQLGLQGSAAGEILEQIKLLNQFNSHPGIYARLPFNLSIH